MSLVKMTNKKTGVTYVYESTSYWDKEKGQPRNKRKLIGKLDPETGEIVPTGKKGSSGGEAPGPDGPRAAPEALEQRDEEIRELRKRILALELELERKNAALERIRRALESSSERPTGRGPWRSGKNGTIHRNHNSEGREG